MLSQQDNNAISDKDPREYFAAIPEEHKEDVFSRALVPPEFRDGSKPYVDFIQKRAIELASAAERLIQNGRLDN
jgi:hypothetical protein